MYLIYLDESWNTGSKLDDTDQPIHFISGLIIPVEKITDIENQLRSIRVLFEPYCQNFDFEFHAVDMVQWKSYFKHFKIATRVQAVLWILQIFEEQNVFFVSQGIDKKALKSKYTFPYHPHNLAFTYLIEKIDAFLEEKGKRWLIIMDNGESGWQGIINDFHRYKTNGTSVKVASVYSRPIKHLVDSVYYTESFNSYCMQFSDVIGYVYATYRLAKLSGNIDSLNFFKTRILDGFEEKLAKKKVYACIDPRT